MRAIITSVLFLVFCLPAMAQDIDNVNDDEPRFMVTANVNYAYRLAKIPKEYNSLQRDYIKKLKSGISYDISAYYKFNSLRGIGLKYNVYRSSNEINNAQISAPDGQTGFGTISDDITISFYGATYIETYSKPNSPHTFQLEAGLGYMAYKNEAEALGSYEFTAGTIGVTINAAYRYSVSESFSFGPQISLIGGSISEFDLTGPNGYNETIKLGSNNRESLTRIDLGIVAAFRF